VWLASHTIFVYTNTKVALPAQQQMHQTDAFFTSSIHFAQCVNATSLLEKF